MRRKSIQSALLFSLFSTLFSVGILAQCETWNGKPNKDDLETTYVVYRDQIKVKNFSEAFDHWQKVYTATPVADGIRDVVFKDGIKIFLDKFKAAGDDKEKLAQTVLGLYDQCVQCYEEKAILLKNCTDDECIKQKIGRILGEKGYDMFYYLNSPYKENMAVLKKAVEYGGMSTLYTIFLPYANMVVYEFKENGMSKEEAREVHTILNEIAEYNEKNNNTLGAYYDQAKQGMNAKFAEIEEEIFDCEYFKEKLLPQYKENPDDFDLIRNLYNTLTQRGCSPDDEDLQELKLKYETYAAEEKARMEAEFEANNPGFVAKKLYDEGKFQEAINKYDEAIASEEDDSQKASYYFSKASILFRKMKSYNSARSAAMKAAKLREGWGRPYLLIGDMYATTSRNCGSDGYTRGLAVLAAIAKYNYAGKIDSEVAEEARQSKLRFIKFIPPKDEVFMRSMKKGDIVTVPCWIGEKVSIDFRQ